jgi:hypothetical protein
MRSQTKKALDELARRNRDRLTPKGVVAAARPVRSPLHREFTWDDKKAGEMWREDEARALIRSYEVVVSVTPFLVKAPMYVRDPSAAPEQGYISMGRLRDDEDLAREVLIQEFDRALSALRRAKEVAHALGMSAEIEKLHWDVQQLSGRAAQHVVRAQQATA